MPRRVSDSRTPFKNSSRASLKLSGLHCRLFHQVAVESVTDSVPAKKTKSISALDKEEEAQMVKLYNDQSKKGVARMVNWLQDKVKTGDVKKD
ncbi:hypothetical protein N0V86_003365 [Didymella sp. IMI 355093]|nr:hypothetical protein N0V86_003365 [Didymella sp. IMI 355093]